MGAGVALVRRIALACGLVPALLGSPAAAGELHLTYAELARVANAVTSTAKIKLNTKPPGFLGLGGGGSSLTLAGTSLPLDIPNQMFPVLGSTYAYYLNDLTSAAVRVVPVAGAVRLVRSFESKAGAMVAACVEGACGLVDALPDVTWRDPTVAVELTVAQVADGLAFKVRKAEIGGTLTRVCKASGVTIASGLCNLGLPWARQTVSRLRSQIDKLVRDRVNTPEAQAALAGVLKPHLKIGSGGDIAIQRVTSDNRGVVVGFRLGE